MLFEQLLKKWAMPYISLFFMSCFSLYNTTLLSW